MKKLILLLALTSCMSTEVIGFTEPIVVTDTTTKKPHKPLPPTPPIPPADTTDGRKPIGFDPTVEDWEEQDINF
jgi:hypothetical protein